MRGQMDNGSTLRMQIELEIECKRKELNKAAEKDLGSWECFQLSLEVDRLLEIYLDLLAGEKK